MKISYECQCNDCQSYNKRDMRKQRLKEQSKMVEFDGWRAAIKDFYGHKCMKCDSTNILHIDHIVPLSVGGDHAMYNMQILCRTCNMSKNNKNSVDYRNYPKLIAIIFQ